jgi:hypothetical protein
VNSYPAWFDDPQGPGDGSCLRYFEEGGETLQYGWNSCSIAEVQNDDSSALFRWKSEDLAEVSVKRDESPPFGGTHVEQGRIGHAVKILIPDRHHIVATGPQQLHSSAADVFV